MKIKLFILLGFLFASSNSVKAEFLLKLIVTDAITQEPLIGAAVQDQKQGIGAISDISGEVNLRVEKDNYNLIVRYIGYKTDSIVVFARQDTTIRIQMSEIFNELAVVNVIANYENRNNGVIGISKETLDMLPTFFGEKELVRALQLLPGVQSGSEGNTSIYVRGGSSDQNLVAFDGVPLFNLSHLFGIMSVFNSDIINSADLYKNYLPTSLSNRLTSAISVFSKTPSYDETHLGFQIGSINTKIFLETPIIKNKLTAQLGVRGCHAGLFIKPITKSQYKIENEKGYISYFFFDINASLNYKINSKNTLKWNFFYTDDRYFMSKEDSELDNDNETKEEFTKNKFYNYRITWRNLLNSVSHQMNINKNLYFNQKLYSTQFVLKQDDIKLKDYTFTNNPATTLHEKVINSKIASVIEYGYQNQLDWIKKQHQLTGGLQMSWRNFNPDKTVYQLYYDEKLQQENQFNIKKIFSGEYAAFFEYALKTKYIDVYSGLRFNYYHTKGYQSSSLLPRLSLEFRLPKSISLQIASNITEQYLHMITGGVGDVMSDYWVPANANAPRQRAFLNVIAIKQNIKDWNWSVDVFHRRSQNQIENITAKYLAEKGNWENSVTSNGIGRAYGVEFYLSKKIKNLNISLSYNLSKTERKFENLNRGQWYPYTYDRRHDVSFLASYKINKKWDVSLTWAYGSGRPFTKEDLIYPSLGLIGYYDDKSDESYPLNNSNQQIKYFEKRNNKKLRDYHHLDLGMNYKWQKGKWKQSINVSIYNVYNHKNVFTLFDKTSGKDENKFKKYQSLTLLPILPSFSYAIGF